MITACKPWLPTSAAVLLTPRSPRSTVLDVHAARLPDSKPSAKINSDELGVFVEVGVGVAVAVGVFVRVFVGVNEGPDVGVFVGVLVGVGEDPGVDVFVGVGVLVGVLVGVEVGTGPTDRKLNASTSLADNPQVLPSK